jgi:hypothetical protein
MHLGGTGLFWAVNGGRAPRYVAESSDFIGIFGLSFPVRRRRARLGPPRERILAIAVDLFYRHGIRAVGVDSIADRAGTNKMTLYRHFASKDELVAEYLRRLADKASSSWDSLAAQHPGNPRGQLRGLPCRERQ